MASYRYGADTVPSLSCVAGGEVQRHMQTMAMHIFLRTPHCWLLFRRLTPGGVPSVLSCKMLFLKYGFSLPLSLSILVIAFGMWPFRDHKFC